MSTFLFAKESMQYGSNKNIPSDLQPEKVITDELLNSEGLYSKKDINSAKFSKFSRFGRVLDPYGRVNPGREYLFFVKPDLHICVPPNYDQELYEISGHSVSSAYKLNGLTLNPLLGNWPYFRDLIDTHPNVIRELLYSIGDNPFGHLLSFSVSNTLPLDSSNAEKMDKNPSTIFGTGYTYLQDSESSDEGYSFSLEFVDDKDLNTYNFFKAYSDYHIARKSGLVTPPSLLYYKYRRLHNTMGIYKFVVAEDMETLIYWAYLCGVYPTSCPRDAFSDASFSEGLTFSVSFEAAFIEDMSPLILYQFNKLMLPVIKANGCTASKFLPIVKLNYILDTLIDGYTHSYDPNVGPIIPPSGYETIGGTQYKIGHTDMINGTLPIGALVDTKVIGNETIYKRQYRLRWYAP